MIKEYKENAMSRNIFVIDDEESILELTRSLLIKKGYTVKLFRNGEDALDQLKEKAPDLIICDHMLPGKSGIEICHEVKSDTKTKHIPFLIMTGQVLLKEPTGGDHRFIKPDAIIIKPFEIDELMNEIDTLLLP